MIHHTEYKLRSAYLSSLIPAASATYLFAELFLRAPSMIAMSLFARLAVTALIGATVLSVVAITSHMIAHWSSLFWRGGRGNSISGGGISKDSRERSEQQSSLIKDLPAVRSIHRDVEVGKIDYLCSLFFQSGVTVAAMVVSVVLAELNVWLAAAVIVGGVLLNNVLSIIFCDGKEILSRHRESAGNDGWRYRYTLFDGTERRQEQRQTERSRLPQSYNDMTTMI